MTLVFDSSLLIEIEKRNKDILEKLKEYMELYPAAPQITFMNYFEFYYGIQDKQAHNKEKALAFINNLDIIYVTKKTAEILSDLKRKYEKLGKAIALADLLIASQVIENKLILVTLDKDFERIEEMNKIILEN
ncbi:type II toxin-antitoxin system VapC family toxin [Candidatus Woesearchaeota archaeon]|nr:type II toxin-antitoxin system VapC family toxin [Candidatus Woesearchaeota archaeon]